MDKTIKTLTEVLQESKKEGTTPYDTTAEVVRIEGNTAWCHIPGGIDETPVSMTIDARAGDIVQVRVSGGRAWITGNQSAPPTDDKKATAAQKSADNAKDTADDAKVTADNAEELAAKANRAAQNVNQYFWHTEMDTGAGAGAHITEVTQEEFLDDPTNGGGNLLAQSGGVFIRDGLQELASMTVDGQLFNNEYSLPVFENGRTERRTYNNKIAWYKYSNESPFEIVLAWDVQSIAHVYGYDASRNNVYTVTAANYSLDGRTLTIDATACSALTSANVKNVVVWYKAEGRFPFLTFGSRIDSGTIGNYSAVIGENNVASGSTSAAFGDSNISSGVNSFSAGIDNKAQYGNSAAFGEGNVTMADHQFVVGKFNQIANKHLFTVGKGTDDNNRSNAFAVAENGDIYIGSNKLADYVIERGTSGNWKYIKWKSGRVECEGYTTFPSLTFSQRGSLYRSPATPFTIPSGIFSNAPTEGQAFIMSGSASDYWGAVIGSLTTTGGNCMVWKATSGNGTNINVHMRLIYR